LIGYSLGDDVQDSRALAFGACLYDRFAEGQSLTFPAFQLWVQTWMPMLATKQPLPTKVRPDVANLWPYSVGYFDPTK
jgi:hypothetical protein